MNYFMSKEEQDFLEQYDMSAYDRPSVTADILIYTVKDDKLNLMLIKRKDYPFINVWAIPGGFITRNETVYEAAKRELEEETNITNCHIEQFDVFSKLGRDPRGWIISNAFVALVPYESLYKNMQAGDDAKEVNLFEIQFLPNSTHVECLKADKVSITLNDLGFDHSEIIQKSLQFLQKKIKSNEDNFIFLNLLNKDGFTLFDVQKVYEAVLNEKLTKPNFRRWFDNQFIKTGKAVYTENKIQQYQRPAKVYKLAQEA